MINTTPIKEMLFALCKKYELPKSSLFISENRSKKNNTLNGYTIGIFEPSYPEMPNEEIRQSKNVLNMRPSKEGEWHTLDLRMQADQEAALSSYLPPDAERVCPLPAIDVSTGFTRIRIGSSSPNLVKYIASHVTLCIENYSSNAQKFGCCGKYVECSDAKKCLHENKLYSTSCSYRANLEQGRIFYGKNANV